MRPHPKALSQTTLPPEVDQALRDARALLAAVPQLVGDVDGADVYLSTEQMLAAKEPLVFGVIYADDDLGKAIADMVLRLPQLLGPIIEHLEQPIARSVAIAASKPETQAEGAAEPPARTQRRRQSSKPEARPAREAAGDLAELHLEQVVGPAEEEGKASQALEVAQADPTKSLPPGEGWTTVVCLCGKEFWFPPVKKVGMLRCYQCIGAMSRGSRLRLLEEHLPKSA